MTILKFTVSYFLFAFHPLDIVEFLCYESIKLYRWEWPYDKEIYEEKL